MITIKEALWYGKLPKKIVYCGLCPHECTFGPGKKGKCRVRLNVDGVLYSANYGKAGGFAMDPIEKKPLYNYYPGTYVLSAGARGCNLRCDFCQNWQLAHGEHEEVDITPMGMVNAAEKYSAYYDVIGLAYTYSEPFMWYEFVLDTSKLARQSGLKNVMVTNGFVNEEPLEHILPHIDAMNIDVKAFTNDFYERIAHGTLAPVLDTAERAKASGCHVEITTLLIPGLNDSQEEIEQLVEWVSGTLGRDTPLHFSRYFPNYKLDLDPTPVDVLKKAREIAQGKLDYVYLGNAGAGDYVNTDCPRCGNIVVRRDRGKVDTRGLKGRDCSRCGEKINVITRN